MTIAFDRRGSGPPLVLIHGIGHRWQAWQPVLDRLAEHHDVVAIDLPGFGASPVPVGGMPHGMAATVAAVGEVFADLGLDRPHVAGNSLGGAISLELAADGLAASATALSPAGFFTEAERRRALRILSRMRWSTFAPGVMMRPFLRSPRGRAVSFGPIVALPGQLEHDRAVGDALAMRRGKGFRAVVRASAGYAYAGTPACPVTVGWGERDHIFGVHQLDRARERLPQARHERLPGCGHVPMSDDPAAVARLILTTTGAVSA
ncbi:pimeloyl-ACP methyl ester carboxylesterase [Allocatelliglobosispora scoriae]|uniref:Pimeloyl-ACP methyl ester carboxylesterase n=1 Tax=Allocatelliglobosispora scoriae TaxID=643052 RepID=A0A841C2B4_9ACTN|nr:alpha/beta fold hydrolase [Allocatelliglobosispora scoriae]MBB5873001.1 pimeloyl-ACP methyl ester carboxylesterase [Allocatelliglobosispora scoriae]